MTVRIERNFWGSGIGRLQPAGIGLGALISEADSAQSNSGSDCRGHIRSRLCRFDGMNLYGKFEPITHGAEDRGKVVHARISPRG